MSIFNYLGRKRSENLQAIDNQLDLARLKANQDLQNNQATQSNIQSIISGLLSGSKMAYDQNAAAAEKKRELDRNDLSTEAQFAALFDDKLITPEQPKQAKFSPDQFPFKQDMGAQPAPIPQPIPVASQNEIPPPPSNANQEMIFSQAPSMASEEARRKQIEEYKNKSEAEIASRSSQAGQTPAVQPQAQAPLPIIPPKSSADVYMDEAGKQQQQQPPKPSATYRRYGKTFDEVAKANGLSLDFPDPRVKAKEIMANKKATEGDDFWGKIFGVDTARADSIAEKRLAVEIANEQAKIRDKRIKEINDLVKQEELRNAPGARSERLAKFGTEALRMQEAEREEKLSEVIGGKYGPQFVEALSEPDVNVRANKIRAVLERSDSFRTPELNERDAVTGFIISEAINRGEDLIKNRKSNVRSKADPLISDTTLKEMAQMRASLDNLANSSSSEFATMNAVINAVSAVSGDTAAMAQEFKKQLTTNPEAISADAKIRRNIAAYLKATSGLAATDAEFQRIYASAPNDSDPPQVYYAKLNSFIQEIGNYHDRVLQYNKDSGRNTANIQPIGKQELLGIEKLNPEQSKKRDEILNKYK